MQEIERRYYTFDEIELKAKLAKNGFVSKGAYKFRIVQYKMPKGFRFRIRDEGTKITCTLKKEKKPFDIEYEVIVNDFKILEQMLKLLKFKPLYVFEKIREIYTVDGVECVFDHLPAMQPWFEIEAKTTSLLSKYESLLGLKKEPDRDIDPYKHFYGINRGKNKNLSFALKIKPKKDISTFYKILKKQQTMHLVNE